jgi:hypothetical protein
LGAPSIDAASIASAQAEASRTGIPQPVKDTAGNTVYYVDYQGAVVPEAVAKDAEQRSPQGQAQTRADRVNDGTINPRGGLNNADQAAAQRSQLGGQLPAETQTALKNQAANVARGYVWVNGQLSRIVGFDAQGQPIINYEGGGLRTTGKDGKVTNDPTKPAQNQTAFGALPSNSTLNGASIFTMSSGPADIFNGQTQAGDGFGGATPTYGSGDHSQSANTVSNARSQMTVAQGVQWFLNLAVQHKDQYQHLVDMLHTAKYLTDAQWASARGGYSSDAAQQFALAAMDLAQVNTTEGGANLGLFDFLDQKAKDSQATAAAAVQPVTRAFQDPATLKYAARQAAQNVLGRNLTPAEEAAFESQFRGKENAYYDNVDATNQAQVGAQAAGTRGPANSVPQPDTTGQADSFVQGDQFANQRNGYSMLEYVKAFQDLLGNGKL